MGSINLSDDLLKKYEGVLKEEKVQCQRIIRDIDNMQKKGSKDSSGNLSSYSIHQADLGTDTDQAETNVFMLNREIDRLKEINVALGRIYDKSYGICQICGEYIPEKRLAIVPYAKYCIVCKSKEEKKKRRR